jgi:hypothetical protein
VKVHSPEYEALKRFLETAWSFVRPGPIAEELDPMWNLKRIEERTPAQAGKGLQMAVNDILSMLSTFSSQRLLELDDALRKRGAPKIAEVEVSYSQRLKRIQKAGKIRTESEYHLVKSTLDMKQEVISRQDAERLIDEFEKI